MRNQARIHQISSLKKNIPTIQQVSSDDSQWIIQLLSSEYKLICFLCIYLPEQFPSVSPVVYCSFSSDPWERIYFSSACRASSTSSAVTVTHPWIDSETERVIGHPKLRENSQWNEKYELGDIIKEIVEEFKIRPPRKTDKISFSTSGYSVSSAEKSSSFSCIAMSSSLLSTHQYDVVSSRSVCNEELKSTEINFPAYLQNLDYLDAYNEEELEFLSQNQDALVKFIKNLPEILSYAARIEALSKENKKRLDSIKEKLNSQKTQRIKKEFRDVTSDHNKLCFEMEEVLSKKNDLLSKYDLSNLSKTLLDEANIIYNDCENLCEEFKNKKIDRKDFEFSYIKQKERYHTCIAKIEKLNFYSSQNISFQK